jgi:glucosamine-6-phosphate deaminase
MSAATVPDYLEVPPEQLGEGEPVAVRVSGDMQQLASDFADDMLAEIEAVRQAGRSPTFIAPVGPVDHYPILAERINERRIDCRDLTLIQMDEYLDESDRMVPEDHPLSFRGFLRRKFYDLLDADLAPTQENRVCPSPEAPEQLQQIIDERGGVDACFGGIGINGHIAFNEPPEPGEPIDTDGFAERPTRVLSLSRETKTINSVTVGGGIEVIPPRAVTVGMKEVLAARKLRLYCNRPWQAAVIRRALHGPISAACPSSLMRRHPDAAVTLAEYVHAKPDIRLR